MTAVPPDDRGLLLGDGLFETLLALAGRPLFLAEHLARLVRGCAVLGLPPPEEPVVRRAVGQALAVAGLTDGRAAVRLTWTAGSGGRGLDRPAALQPRLVVTAAPAPLPTGPARLAIVSVRRNPSSPASRLKTLAYLDNVLARREALAAGADEAVMLNTAGEVACAAAANLFWVRDGRLCTPALDCGVLDGIVRSQILPLAAGMGVEAGEVRADAEALGSAEAIFLTSSLIGVRGVSRLGDREWSAHPLTTALAAAWAALSGYAARVR
jgi:branched-subunit amino acid aminotransferase/4-amino-4-deoxychorismate lyase